MVYNLKIKLSYNDGSGFGYDQDTTTGYTHDDDGQYTTENTITGELDAGWNTGHYHQDATGIETFTDSAINYHSVGLKGKNIEVSKKVVNKVENIMNKLNTPIGRIATKGIISAITGALSMKSKGIAGVAYGFTFGLASGLVVGVALETDLDISRYTKLDIAKDLLGF